MALFGLNKKGDLGSAPSFQQSQASVPLDQVQALRQQGLSNTQIIQSLQQQGYNTSQIYDALSQADVKGAVEPSPMEPMQPIQNYGAQAGADGGDQGYYGGGTSALAGLEFGGGEQRIEEIAEAIIEEKWNELIKNVNKIIDWKEKTETRITQLEQRMTDLRKDFETLHTGVLGKVGEYDQNLTNLGAEIKAMEKVFSKILPTFTENVNELSRLSREMKSKSDKQ